ncbi:uncharacterized protein LOC129585319 [Paramacrobiotus metropolitanus]|uniref:uncharacterized protein LOC129585319 n=1 Tax=Paramacrobiotus metropolitanus TaxID=2943436 RepID=UPI00244598A2|nr:uncharacterized protein LOC129585319 [Paramacrobiotus metropolitanus]
MKSRGSNYHWANFALFCGITCFLLLCVSATNRYYFSYLPYSTGDNIVTTWHMHGGPTLPNRKWNVECLDGEAMIGITDQIDDFQRIAAIWCRFMFPYKPPSNGVYPYYPSCVFREYRYQFFCFDTQNASTTINTFMTGIWDNEWIFWVARIGTTRSTASDYFQPYKCCKVPKGYYIDYVSCYYVSTHDPYWEFYDNVFNFVVYCGTGYVMTGIAKKIHPVGQDWYIDWIQCCRVGYGFPSAVSPPLIRLPDGRTTFYAASNTGAPSTPVPRAYQQQHRSLSIDQQLDTAADSYMNASDVLSKKFRQFDDIRYKREAIPVALLGRSHPPDPAAHCHHDGREIMFRTDLTIR